jgi:hypothetical protein
MTGTRVYKGVLEPGAQRGTPGGRGPRGLWAAAVITVILLIMVSAWVRGPGFTQGGFASHDVGGILYEAMLLHAGLLPYVDSVELKAPGTFYLAALLAGPAGRDIAAFQIAANVTALLSLVALTGLAWRLWGAAAALLAAIVYALHDAALDRMDANYVTWAQLPQILAMAVGVAAMRATTRRRTLAMWALCGALCASAALCKQPAGVILVPALIWAARGAGRFDGKAGAAVLAGFAAMHGPVALHYAAHGQLAALVTGYAFNPWGLAYITQRGAAGPLAELWEGAAATVHTLALPLALAGFAVVRRLANRTGPMGQDPADRLGWLGSWFAATLIAACVGLRFYRGYFLAVLPPLCLLAASPWGVRALLRPPVRRLRAGVAGLVIAVLVARAVVDLAAIRDDRRRPHDAGARAVARYVQLHSREGDTIWVWGWHLWGVHALSGRLSGSRVYKTLGLLTPPNDDTWRRPASTPQVTPENRWMAVLLADLERTRPAVIVLGGTTPRTGLGPLRRMLQAGYHRDRCDIGKVECWRLRDPVDPNAGLR